MRVAPGAVGRIGFLGQAPERMFYRPTAWGELGTEGADAPAEERAEILVQRLGLRPEALRARAAFHFSAGEQRRIALAVQLLRDPRVLLLDEPTAGLDAQAVKAVCQALRDASSAAMAIVIATHDLGQTAGLASRFFSLSHGIPHEWPHLRALVEGVITDSSVGSTLPGASDGSSRGEVEFLPAWWRVAKHIATGRDGSNQLPCSELEIILGVVAGSRPLPPPC